jgi:hypothetical protein
MTKFSPSEFLGPRRYFRALERLLDQLPMRTIFLGKVQVINKRNRVGKATDLAAKKARGEL